jgi:nicotinamide N-methyltransferase
LELGAGAGLPSLTAAMCGAGKVVITDYPDQSLVDNMVWNADVNLTQEVRGNVDVEGFVWGAKVDSLLEKSGGEGYDVLILSDLVFNHSQVCQLSHVIYEVMRGADKVAFSFDRIMQFAHIDQTQ